ncbi:protein rolling stone-like [Belonocnema kinseyi]|uniref:protein rolling stone-like n=1 Tax=Belonocnema kinseyi TaxID=2817044 RepID=UPI00143D5449|nr:protein rolling stone-like [Belonocnema kinseyi]
MVVFSFRGFSPIKRLLSFSGQCCACRRAMVNKLWYRVSRKWSRLKTEPPHARLFSESRFQETVESWYLIYRWIVFLSWASIIICSVFKIGSHEPRANNQLWAIYLTNWDLILGLTQSLLGAIIVSRRWNLQKLANFNPDNLNLSLLERTYWFLYVVTSSMAICVTIIYWGAVFDPKTHVVDFLNILLHVCNSLLMIVDLCIVKVPFIVISFWWCLLVALAYVLFSAIYFVAGGVDKLGNRFIYPILNWEKPGMTLGVCFGVTIFLIIVHCLFCLAASLATRKCRREKDDSKLDNVQSISVKQVELII